MYPKAFLLMACVLASAALGATVPLNGDFDIDHVPGEIMGISFDPIPWNDPESPYFVYIFPYATPDYTERYSGYTSEQTNLGQASLNRGVCTYTDDPYGMVRGDLAIRFLNNTNTTITLTETVVTLNLDGGALDVYLPEFSFNSRQNMHFWIGADGSSYFANSSHGPGGPDMSAAESIDGGHLAAVPEPATMILLAAGTVVILRKRKA